MSNVEPPAASTVAGKGTSDIRHHLGAKKLRPGTEEWVRELFVYGLGYPSPHDWQIENTLHAETTDIFITTMTGSGKSALIHAPTVARKVTRQKRRITLAICPLTALMDDQVRTDGPHTAKIESLATHYQVKAAEHRGLKAITINHDTLREAQKATPKRNLWAEARALQWDIIFLSPEMLTSKPFNDLIMHAGFRAHLAYCVVDEAHLVHLWGRAFRPMYTEISRLRSRIPPEVIWIAMTATLKYPQGRALVQQMLGYTEGLFRDVRLPCDRRDIKLCPRFLKHSISGYEFPDFAWLFPEVVPEGGYPRTLIVVDTILKATRFVNWADALLPEDLPNRDHIIEAFHSLIVREDRESILRDLESGDTRFIVATLAANVGLDLKVDRIVILDLPEIIETLLQWIGRVGRQGQGGKAYIYAPDALRKENVVDLDGEAGRGAMSEAMLKRRKAAREAADRDIVAMLNPGKDNCNRSVLWDTMGEPGNPERPRSCCTWKTCQPEPEEVEAHNALVAAYLVRRATSKISHRIQNLPKEEGDFGPFEKDLQDEAVRRLQRWRMLQLIDAEEPKPRELPATRILLDDDVKKLSSALHQATSEERLAQLMEPSRLWQMLSVRAKTSLWCFVRDLGQEFLTQMAERPEVPRRGGAKGKGKAQAKTKRKIPARRQTEDESDHATVDDVIVPRADGKRVLRPSARARGRVPIIDSDGAEDDAEDDDYHSGDD